MADYNKLINEVKSKLAALNSPDSELKKLYKQAIEQSKTEYNAKQAELLQELKQAENDSSAKSLIKKKNNQQKAESSGLSGAGINAVIDESRKDKLNSEITELEADIAEEQSELDSEYKDSDAKLTVEQEKAIVKEQTSLEKELERLETAKAKASADAIEATEKQAEKEAKEKAEAEKSAKYKPTISAKELAKTLISRFSGKAEALKAYLDELTAENDFDEDYLKDLMFSFKAYGWGADEAVETKPENEKTNSLVDESKLVFESKAVYKDLYEKVYKTFKKQGSRGPNLTEKAAKFAQIGQMDFFYKSTATTDEFEALCKAVNMSDSDIADYYKRVEFFDTHDLKGEKLILGEYLDK
ncbi:MAG: hypothetical protein A2Y17_08045 [Clostridiales bacterium GWF2_38_85]|nr:MAG: hypothetical protein A2Y17_08045 [Clostridiales bacterium GWF2_38_85]HBL83857.1 hypothetical protein [Clostridiales bacterium]